MTLIKYNPGATGNTPAETGVLRKGDMYIDPVGPAKNGLFYNAIPATGGTGNYVYYDGEGSQLSIRTFSTDAGLTAAISAVAGINFPSAGTALAWVAGQRDKLVVNREYQPIVTDGLVLNLDASYVPSYPTTGTTWYDISGNVNNGINGGGPGWTALGWFSYTGGNGVSANDSNSLDITDNISTELWFYPTDYATSEYSLNIFRKYSSINDANFVWYFAGLYPGSGQLVVWTNRGGNWDSSSPVSSAIPLNQWTHAVWTYSNGGRLYINGVSQGNPVGSGNLSTNSATVDIGYDLRGNISIARIYSKALSQTEILQNYYGGPIVTSGLVMALDAANLVSYPRSGTVWYGLTGGVTGALIGTPTFDSSYGGSIAFDGSDDTVSMKNSNLNFPGYISMCAWVKYNDYSTYPIIIHKGNHYTFRLNGVSNQWTYADSSNWDYASFGSRTVADLHDAGKWMFLVVTKDTSNDVRLYKNGILVDTRTNFGSALISKSPDTTLWLSGYSDTDTPPNSSMLNGNLSHVQIYNRTLSAAEIKQNYDATKWRFGLD